MCGASEAFGCENISEVIHVTSQQILLFQSYSLQNTKTNTTDSQRSLLNKLTENIFLVYLTKNTGKDLRMSNKVTAVSKQNNILLLNCMLYHDYTNLIVRDCHDLIISTSGIQSLS